MSSDENNVSHFICQVIAPVRKTHKLQLDSEEEERIEAEQLRKQEEIKQRKEEKRKKKEEEAKRKEEEQLKLLEMQKKYEDPAMMFEEDSNSHDSFQRVEEKIKKAFPGYKKKEDLHKKRRAASQDSDESSDSEDSQSEDQSSERHKRSKKKTEKREKKQKKVEQKKQRNHEDEPHRHAKQTSKVKIQESDAKENLVREVSRRWWYCIPQWPPQNYPYEQQLKKQGYRLVDASKFRLEDDIVNGFQKVSILDGYIGVYKSKTKLIDVRPKATCPSVSFFRTKPVEELTNLLKTALKTQIGQLSSRDYLQQDEKELIKDLQRQLTSLK